ncbi:hypothetical protein HDV06_003982 [Boothiomyces sp. JEL0866]|nr:hypothetical protein HDV06_003982 [Boothiomyces sp. JEL0866]
MQNTIRKSIKPGIIVRVIQKQDQRTGKLTEGVVKDILTNSGQHHRGIKVRLVSGIVGRVAELVEPTSSGRAAESIEPNSSHSKARIIINQEIASHSAKERESSLISDFIPNSIISNIDPLSTWPCKACTYENGVYSNECEICNTPK